MGERLLVQVSDGRALDPNNLPIRDSTELCGESHRARRRSAVFRQGLRGLDMKGYQQSSRSMGTRWIPDHDRVSRQDLTRLRDEMHTGMQGLRREMDGMRSEMRGEIDGLRIEVKNDIYQLRNEVKGDIGQLRSEMKGEITQLRTEVKADIKGLTEGMTSLREGMAGLSRSVNLMTKLVMLLMAAAIAAGGWNAIRNNDRSTKPSMLALAETTEDGDAE